MTARPGLASGRMSRQNVPNGGEAVDLPPRLVDLARDGVEEAFIIQAQNGTEMVRYVMTRPAAY